MPVSQPISRERIQRRLSLFRNEEGKETPLTIAVQVGHLHEVLRRSGKMESGNREAIAAVYREKLEGMLTENKSRGLSRRFTTPLYAKQLVEAGYGKAAVEILKAQGHGFRARRLEKQITANEKSAETALKRDFLAQREYPLVAARYYLRAGKINKAVSALQKGGTPASAVHILRERGKQTEAARLLAEQDKPYLAIKVLEQGGNPNAAARLLKSLRKNTNTHQTR